MSAEASITAIQTGIETVLGTVSGLTVLENVPKTIRDFPAGFVYLAGPEQDEWETGGGTDNHYRFAVAILVKDDRDIGAAMIAHGTWVGKVLDAFRADATLDDSCDFYSITDGGDPKPVEDGTSPYVAKYLYVTARTTES